MIRPASTAAITIRPAYADDEARSRASPRSTAPTTPRRTGAAGRGRRRGAGGALAHDGSVIADPFRPTLHLLALLRTHAGQTARPATPQRRCTRASPSAANPRSRYRRGVGMRMPCRVKRLSGRDRAASK